MNARSGNVVEVDVDVDAAVVDTGRDWSRISGIDESLSLVTEQDVTKRANATRANSFFIVRWVSTFQSVSRLLSDFALRSKSTLAVEATSCASLVGTTAARAHKRKSEVVHFHRTRGVSYRPSGTPTYVCDVGFGGAPTGGSDVNKTDARWRVH